METIQFVSGEEKFDVPNTEADFKLAYAKLFAEHDDEGDDEYEYDDYEGEYNILPTVTMNGAEVFLWADMSDREIGEKWFSLNKKSLVWNLMQDIAASQGHSIKWTFDYSISYRNEARTVIRVLIEVDGRPLPDDEVLLSFGYGNHHTVKLPDLKERITQFIKTI